MDAVLWSFKCTFTTIAQRACIATTFIRVNPILKEGILLYDKKYGFCFLHRSRTISKKEENTKRSLRAVI